MVQSDCPYIRQGDDDSCAAAVLQMLWVFYGMPAEEQPTLMAQMGGTREGGVSNANLAAYLKRHFVCEVRADAALSDLRDAIDRSRLVVVNFLVPQSGCQINDSCYPAFDPDRLPPEALDGHFALAIGQDRQTIRLHDPWLGPNVPMPFGQFERVWRGFYSPGVKRWMAAISGVRALVGNLL